MYGIPILLELISDHASVGIDVFQEAFTNLKNLVSWPRLSTYRHLFASICIQSLAVSTLAFACQGDPSSGDDPSLNNHFDSAAATRVSSAKLASTSGGS